jgi:hypothetical protein
LNGDVCGREETQSQRTQNNDLKSHFGELDLKCNVKMVSADLLRSKDTCKALRWHIVPSRAIYGRIETSSKDSSVVQVCRLLSSKAPVLARVAPNCIWRLPRRDIVVAYADWHEDLAGDQCSGDSSSSCVRALEPSYPIVQVQRLEEFVRWSCSAAFGMKDRVIESVIFVDDQVARIVGCVAGVARQARHEGSKYWRS